MATSFLDSLNETTRVLMVCSGPVESKANGYYRRCKTMFDLCELRNARVQRLELSAPSKIDGTLQDFSGKTVLIHSYNKTIQNKITSLLTFDPLYVFYSQAQINIGLLKNIQMFRKSDFILIEGSLLPFANFIARMLGKNIILDTHAINVDIAQKLSSSNKIAGNIRKLLWYPLEWFTLRLSSRAVAVSDRDSDIIYQYYHIDKNRIEVIALTSEVIIGKYRVEVQKIINDLNIHNKSIILFIGDLGAVHNRQAAQFIVEELAPHFDKYSKLVFLIVGANPTKLSTRDNVIFTGFVDKIEPYIVLSTLCIAPLEIGGGVKTKVLDYLAFDKIVLCTPTAAEGMIIKSTHSIIISSIGNFKNETKKMIDQLTK